MNLREKIFLITLYGFVHCQLLGQSNGNPFTEKSVMDTIWILEEVKLLNENVIKESGGTRKLSVILYKKPYETSSGYYWLKVAEDNGVNYVSHFNFFVYRVEMTIVYFDTLNNVEIELSEWREQMNKK